MAPLGARRAGGALAIRNAGSLAALAPVADQHGTSARGQRLQLLTRIREVRDNPLPR
jgi:hypothetical protein